MHSEGSRRFTDGELTADDIEAWADAIECREDIDYSGEDPAGIALHQLANPAINGGLTTSVATELIVLLSARSSSDPLETK